MERGGITLKILNFLEEAASSTEAILGLFLTDRTTSYRLARGLPPKRSKRRAFYNERALQIEKERIEKHRLYNTLYHLKEDGLIHKTKKGLWFPTAQGKVRKQLLIAGKNNHLPPFAYNIEKSAQWIIVVFDIPEKIKRKRVWLRAVLKRFGFQMLQKSVWIGRVKLPEKFIHDLHRVRLLSYVEILQITKSGSLRGLEKST